MQKIGWWLTPPKMEQRARETGCPVSAVFPEAICMGILGGWESIYIDGEDTLSILAPANRIISTAAFTSARVSTAHHKGAAQCAAIPPLAVLRTASISVTPSRSNDLSLSIWITATQTRCKPITAAWLIGTKMRRMLPSQSCYRSPNGYRPRQTTTPCSLPCSPAPCMYR